MRNAEEETIMTSIESIIMLHGVLLSSVGIPVFGSVGNQTYTLAIADLLAIKPFAFHSAVAIFFVETEIFM